MSPTSKAIRRLIRHIPGAWVRSYPSGEVWAGRWRPGGSADPAEVREALEAAGYRCAMNGTPGTSGEHIIDVKEPA